MYEQSREFIIESVIQTARAPGDSRAGHAVVVPPGHVDAAGLVRDPVLRDPLVGRARVTPVTAVPGTAGHQNLSRKSKLYITVPYTVKKRLSIFPSPAGMSLTKLSLKGNNFGK